MMKKTIWIDSLGQTAYFCSPNQSYNFRFHL